MTLKAIKYKSRNPSKQKITLKWNTNGEISSIDMARIINALSLIELTESDLTSNRVSNIKKNYNLGIWQ